MLISHSHFFLVVIGKDEFLNLFNFMSDNSKLSHYHSLLCSLHLTILLSAFLVLAAIRAMCIV